MYTAGDDMALRGKWHPRLKVTANVVAIQVIEQLPQDNFPQQVYNSFLYPSIMEFVQSERDNGNLIYDGYI